MVIQHRNEQIKVLSGKTFFLDLKGSPATRIRALEIHLKGLGGIVQTVFTKSINFLITNQRLGERRLRSEATVKAENSRRYILEKAALWNVEIKHIDQVSKWINSLSVNQKPIKTTNKMSHTPPLSNRTQKVRRNVIKVEDNSRKYRPTIKNIPTWPMVVPNSSPTRSGVVTRKDAKKQVPAVSTRRTAVTGTALNKPQGYCESCDVRFVNAIRHFKSAKHLKFISNENNYDNLNKELQKGKTVDDFLEEMTALDSKASTSAVTTRQRRPASAPTTRTPKQMLQRKRTQSSSSNRVPSAFRTPARGAGALSSPPSDVSLTPMVVSSRPTAIGHSVKRKLFLDDNDEDNDEPRATKNTKMQNKGMVSAKRGRRSSNVVQDLQERLRHLPDVNVHKIKTVPTMHKTRRSSQTKKTRNSASIRRIVSTLKEGLKYESPVLTLMEMRNGKMKICNTK